MKVEQSQSKIGVMYLSGKKENVLSKTQKAGCRTGRKGFQPIKSWLKFALGPLVLSERSGSVFQKNTEPNWTDLDTESDQ